MARAQRDPSRASALLGGQAARTRLATLLKVSLIRSLFRGPNEVIRESRRLWWVPWWCGVSRAGQALCR